MEKEFIYIKKKNNVLSGTTHWNSPSNIALIKYWGKKSNQIPSNPSLSFSLNKCFTSTKVSFTKTKIDSLDFNFFFHGKREQSFENKLKNYFDNISLYCSFLNGFKLKVESTNSFPHSSGIASSASSFAALSLCIMDIEKKINPSMSENDFFRKASFLARLGSGSACRSIKGFYSLWGQSDLFEKSSNLYSVKYSDKIKNVFKSLHDTVLIVDKKKKKFSSTQGHELMQNHIFSEARVSQAKVNLSLLKNALKFGDFNLFIKVVESEALSLHALMMTSDPQFILMKPNTLNIINKIWDFRKKTNTNICFTLDAGANVHLIYPKKEFESVQNFIISDLSVFCESGKFINDMIGNGSLKL